MQIKQRIAIAIVIAFVLGPAAWAQSEEATFFADDTTRWRNSDDLESNTAQISTGAQVVWENRTAVTHTVVCVQAQSNNLCPFKSEKTLPPASEAEEGNPAVTAAFPQPGTYTFQCTIFPRMIGQITVGRGVQDPSPYPSPSPSPSLSPPPSPVTIPEASNDPLGLDPALIAGESSPSPDPLLGGGPVSGDGLDRLLVGLAAGLTLGVGSVLVAVVVKRRRSRA